MDSCFNLQIPASTDKVVVIRPKGKTFITGIASSYECKYDEARLKDYISLAEFTYVIELVNASIHSHWPCSLSIWIGYILAPFTLCLSFLIPNICIADAKTELKNVIAR